MRLNRWNIYWCSSYDNVEVEYFEQSTCFTMICCAILGSMGELMFRFARLCESRDCFADGRYQIGPCAHEKLPLGFYGKAWSMEMVEKGSIVFVLWLILLWYLKSHPFGAWKGHVDMQKMSRGGLFAPWMLYQLPLRLMETDNSRMAITPSRADMGFLDCFQRGKLGDKDWHNEGI